MTIHTNGQFDCNGSWSTYAVGTHTDISAKHDCFLGLGKLCVRSRTTALVHITMQLEDRDAKKLRHNSISWPYFLLLSVSLCVGLCALRLRATDFESSKKLKHKLDCTCCRKEHHHLSALFLATRASSTWKQAISKAVFEKPTNPDQTSPTQTNPDQHQYRCAHTEALRSSE
jgi:hypothetical protein